MNSMAKTTTYTLGYETEKAIEDIRSYLGATSNSEVVRRAIALMKLAVHSADDQKRIELKDAKDDVMQRIPLI